MLEPAWPDLAATSPTWAPPCLGTGPQEPVLLRRDTGSQDKCETSGEAAKTPPHLEGLAESGQPGGNPGTPPS